MPYNYLIDPKIRENFKIDYENSIIILDEAHNVEKVSEDVASFEINIQMLSAVLGELSTMCTQIEHAGIKADDPNRQQEGKSESKPQK